MVSVTFAVAAVLVVATAAVAQNSNFRKILADTVGLNQTGTLTVKLNHYCKASDNFEVVVSAEGVNIPGQAQQPLSTDFVFPNLPLQKSYSIHGIEWVGTGKRSIDSAVVADGGTDPLAYIKSLNGSQTYVLDMQCSGGGVDINSGSGSDTDNTPGQSDSPTPSPGEPATACDSTFNIEGTVYETANGQVPVSGAEVGIIGLEKDPHTITTSQDGKFKVDGVVISKTDCQKKGSPGEVQVQIKAKRHNGATAP